MKDDAQVQEDVLRELRWDGRVDDTDIGVEVDNAAVTLTGTVTTYASRHAAQEAAHRVFGVLDVVNNLEVRVPGGLVRNDTDIAHAVRHALEWDVSVPDERIRSTVADGWVTLDGEVTTWSDRDAAERAIRNLPGVRGLVNQISVNLPYVRTDAIEDAIEKALERRAERHAHRIAINVRNNEVELTGDVQSWAERKAIVGAARYTPGVQRVTDRLRYAPSA